MPKSLAAFRRSGLVSGSLCMQPSFCAAQGEDAVVKAGPDLWSAGVSARRPGGAMRVANFDSFTLDFARMTFRRGEPLAADKAH